MSLVSFFRSTLAVAVLTIAIIGSSRSVSQTMGSKRTTSEQTSSLTVYVLDSMDLAMLGIYVEANGSVYFAASSKTLTYMNRNNLTTRIGRPNIDANPPSPNSARKLAYSSTHAPVEIYWSDPEGRRREYTDRYKGVKPPVLAGKSGQALHSTEGETGAGSSRIYAISYTLESALDHRLANLVPIRVPMPTLAATGSPEADRYEILWYEKSQELLDILPAPVRAHIASAAGTP